MEKFLSLRVAYVGLSLLSVQACTKDLVAVTPTRTPQRSGGLIISMRETGEKFLVRKVYREVSASTVVATKLDSPLPTLASLTDTSAWVREVPGHCYQCVLMKCDTKTRIPYGVWYTRQYCVPLLKKKRKREPEV